MAGSQSEGANAASVPGELVQNMAHEKPVHGGNSDGPGENGLDQHLASLSLSARAVHADDYLNSHQAVAPPMHVSTTFRYNRDPEKLDPLLNINLCFLYSWGDRSGRLAQVEKEDRVYIL
ncbi:hypothetical protein DL769_010204 [Monosporascus sp. CRB-8-3]|nr:hypothetical protein DL769_010204 [Monosporascus sp. CRB-8-3]